MCTVTSASPRHVNPPQLHHDFAAHDVGWAYLSEVRCVQHGLVAPAHAGEEQDGEEEVVLCAQQSAGGFALHAVQHLHTPRLGASITAVLSMQAGRYALVSD